MKVKIPETKDEYLAVLKTAFLAGQRSIEGRLKHENFGGMEAYASTEAKYNFETWANQIWKYGKNQPNLTSDSTTKTETT